MYYVKVSSCQILISSQFITDKFLYDQSVAMESLLECGLKEQLFELAKVKCIIYACLLLYWYTYVLTSSFHQAHSKLQEALDKMMKQGCMDLSPSVQASLASRQYISTVSEAVDGMNNVHYFLMCLK